MYPCCDSLLYDLSGRDDVNASVPLRFIVPAPWVTLRCDGAVVRIGECCWLRRPASVAVLVSGCRELWVGFRGRRRLKDRRLNVVNVCHAASCLCGSRLVDAASRR